MCILLVALSSRSVAHAQPHDTLMHGVYLLHKGNASFDSTANPPHYRTVQLSSRYPESENEQGVLTNTNGVKVDHEPHVLESVSWARRTEYDVPENLKRFLSPWTQIPDTILYLQNATIYFCDRDIRRLKAVGIVP